MAKKSQKSKSKAKPKAKKPAAKKIVAKAKPKSKPVAKKIVKSKAKPKAKSVAKKVVKAKVKPKAKPAVKKVVKAKPNAKAKPVAKKVVKTKIKPAPQKAEKIKPVEQKVAEVKEAVNPNAIYQAKPNSNFLIPFNTRESERRNILAKKTRVDPNKTQYSDKELAEFKKIIDTKIAEARKELFNLQQQIANANDHGTDDTAGTFKMLEDGSESLAKEEAGQLAARQQKFIEQLENALVRIENKTYGICRVTGKLIPKERLRAVPHTTQSIEAKLNQYRD